MQFLVELDHVRSGAPPSPEIGRAFIGQVIFPTLARGEQLAAEGRIVAGGPVAGRIALRLIVEARSAEDVDALVSSLPIWPLADTHITPLVTFSERRAHVQDLGERLR
jgi:muconolactone delta-isomerase